MEFKCASSDDVIKKGAVFLHDFWVRETIHISKNNPSITLDVKKVLLERWVPFSDLPISYREAYYIRANDLINFIFDITD